MYKKKLKKNNYCIKSRTLILRFEKKEKENKVRQTYYYKIIFLIIKQLYNLFNKLNYNYILL